MALLLVSLLRQPLDCAGPTLGRPQDVSSLCFPLPRCEYFDDGTGYLVADFRIDCHSLRYTQMVIYATCMIFVFPVGIPLWYWWLLYSQRVRASGCSPL